MSNKNWIGVLDDYSLHTIHNKKYKSLKENYSNIDDSCTTLSEGEIKITDCECVGSKAGGLSNGCVFQKKTKSGIIEYASCKDNKCCLDNKQIMDESGICKCYDGDIWNSECNSCCPLNYTCFKKCNKCCPPNYTCDPICDMCCPPNFVCDPKLRRCVDPSNPNPSPYIPDDFKCTASDQCEDEQICVDGVCTETDRPKPIKAKKDSKWTKSEKEIVIQLFIKLIKQTDASLPETNYRKYATCITNIIVKNFKNYNDFMQNLTKLAEQTVNDIKNCLPDSIKNKLHNNIINPDDNIKPQPVVSKSNDNTLIYVLVALGIALIISFILIVIYLKRKTPTWGIY